MVVRIEPFRHLTGGCFAIAARHGIISGQTRLAAMMTEPCGNESEHECHVQHMIVIGKIADGDDVDPLFLLD
ncbi:hypothetical protein D3C85_1864140 [compost metagenome]